MKTIIFTGGHHTSALVLAKALREEGFEIVWLGHKYTMKNVKNVSLEWQEVKKAGLQFIELKSGKIHRGDFLSWLLLLSGIGQAFLILLRFRPAMIVSFGGYLAVPTVLAGFILGIPAVTHEQTVTAGMANRFLDRFVKKVFLTWPESARFFTTRKTVLVGLPLRKSLITQTHNLVPGKTKKLILVTGGKQGSHVINLAIFKILPQLLRDFEVIHQTGETSTTHDFETASNLRRGLPPTLRQKYHIHTYLADDKMSAFLATARCVVSRAGAHIVYELITLAKPAVLIPFPYSYANEQVQNSRKLESLGLAINLRQETLKSQHLLAAIRRQATLPADRITAAKIKAKEEIRLDATGEMVRQIIDVLTKH